MRSPRVLIVSAYYDPFVGGVETHAKTFARYLRDNGVQVQILTKKPRWRSPTRERGDDIPVYRVLPGGPRTNLRKWLMIGPAIAGILRLRDSFDVIYCPGYQGIGIAALLAGRLLRRPVVVTAGNLGVLDCRTWDATLSRLALAPNGALARRVKAPVRRLYASADAHVCVAREIEAEALAAGVPRERVHYLPNAVDTSRFRPPIPGERGAIRLSLGWPEDRVICLFAGRLSEEKGVLELVEAWSRLPSRTHAHLVIAGPDMSGHHLDAGPRARALAARYGIDSSISFLGPRDDIDRLMRAADILIQPSRYEAFGISVIEAMATGLPVIATAVGGMCDYLSDGANALLCPPGSVDALAAAVERLVRDPELRKELGARARRTAEDRFSQEAIFARLAEIIADTGRNARPR